MKIKFREYNLNNIRNKFIAIYILNVTDIIFTYMLINTGVFIEANLIMNRIIDNKVVGLFTKIILAAILLYMIFRRMKRATDKQLKLANKLINLCMILYIFINISHIVWTVWYLYFNTSFNM